MVASIRSYSVPRRPQRLSKENTYLQVRYLDPIYLVLGTLVATGHPFHHFVDTIYTI